jgi:16S rRNA (uracil1498-N3)-methyltransferase
MNRLLVPAGAAVGERVVAGQAESHHLLDVQRVARGRTVRLSDGAGWTADAELVDVVAGRAVFEVRALVVSAPVAERVIVLGMPKAAALEEALVLGTEAGATAFVLVRAVRSPPGELRADRIDRVLRASVTQCGRGGLPEVRGPVTINALGALPAARFIATPGVHVADRPERGAAAAIAVGPEGGWDDAEQDTLEGQGFAPLALGPFILRTPTAVAVGLGRLSHG